MRKSDTKSIKKSQWGSFHDLILKIALDSGEQRPDCTVFGFVFSGVQAQAAGGAASVGAAAEAAAAGTRLPGVAAAAAGEEAPALPLQQEPGAQQQTLLGSRGSNVA